MIAARLKYLLVCLTIVLSFQSARSQAIDTTTSARLFSITRKKTADGKNEVEQFTVVNPDGRRSLSGTFSLNGSLPRKKIAFFINGKVYEEEEAMFLKLSDVSPPGTKYGIGSALNYEVPGVDMSPYLYVYWLGSPPKLSAAAALQQQLFAKYHGKMIVGIVIGPTFKPGSQEPDGFTMQYGKEVFKVAYFPKGEAPRLLKRIGRGDILLFTTNRTGFDSNSNRIILGADTIIKDGERLVINGNVQI